VSIGEKLAYECIVVVDVVKIDTVRLHELIEDIALAIL